MPQPKSRPDSLFETADTPENPRQKRRGIQRFPPQLEMRPSSIVQTPEESREAPHNSKGFLTSHRHHEKFPEFTVATRETQKVSGQLEKYLEIPPSKRIEARYPCRDSREIPSSSSQLKWRLDFSGATREAP